MNGTIYFAQTEFPHRQPPGTKPPLIMLSDWFTLHHTDHGGCGHYRGETVARQKSQRAVQQSFMAARGSGQVRRRLGCAGLDVVRNAQVCHSAYRPAERGTEQHAVEMIESTQ